MKRRSNGEGSIYKRSDGRWCGSYYDEQLNRYYVYGKTQAEVKRNLKEKQESRTVKSKPYLLQDWVLEYYEEYKKNELKASTYSSYMAIYRKHILGSALGKTKLVNVKSMDLQQFYNGKIRNGYSSKTVRGIKVILNEALDMAFKFRMISENPNQFTTLPKKIRYEAKVLTAREVKKIVNEAKEDELYPIVVTTIYTGMRKGEIMALMWENVDFEEHKIFVKYNLCRILDEEPDEKGHYHVSYHIMDPKNKKSVRMIPMLDEVYDALIEQKRRQDIIKETYKDIYLDQGLIFADMTGHYLPQRPFMDDYHRFLGRYGISNIRFHDLRHTFASLLIESGVSLKLVQELLGHSTITTSMDIYGHVSDRMKERALDSLKCLDDLD